MITTVKNRFYKYGQIPTSGTEETIEIGIDKVDNFLSKFKGFVRSSAIFLTGTSGAGKTTLAVFVQALLHKYRTVLYSREMWAKQVEQQCDNINVKHGNAFIADEDSHPTFNDFVQDLDNINPDVVTVDSLQVIAKQDFPDMPEDDAIYHIIRTLREWTNKNNAVLVVIGHVTKGGIFAGKNTIKQMFDVHMEMIFDEKNNERYMKTTKNRKGVLGKLFYDFIESGLEFFTPQEWEIKTKGVTLGKVILDAIKNRVDGYKNHSGFKEFKKELTKIQKGILAKKPNNIEFTIEFLPILDQKIKEYFG